MFTEELNIYKRVFNLNNLLRALTRFLKYWPI